MTNDNNHVEETQPGSQEEKAVDPASEETNQPTKQDEQEESGHQEAAESVAREQDTTESAQAGQEESSEEKNDSVSKDPDEGQCQTDEKPEATVPEEVAPTAEVESSGEAGDAPEPEEQVETGDEEPAPETAVSEGEPEPVETEASAEVGDAPEPDERAETGDEEPAPEAAVSEGEPEPVKTEASVEAGEASEPDEGAEAAEGSPKEEAVTPDESSQEGDTVAPVEAKSESTGEEDKDESSEAKEESFEELLEHYDHYRQYRPGDVVQGTVVRVDEEEVLLDIGARIEGAVPKAELCDAAGEPTVKFGDKVDVMVCRFDKGAQYIPLSFERARMSKVWDKIEGNAEENQLIEGVVVEKVKGGFIVDIGVRAFLPTSLATLRPQKDYQDLLGNTFSFQITKLQRRRGNIILSRKEILKEEYEKKRAELLETLEEGAVISGHVKNITDYGAFIDLGGLDGLLHITDMSWGRVNHPKDILDLNQEIEVKVLRIDREKEKVSLGLKQITPDPWLSAPEKYPPGTKVDGMVLNLTGFGAFVELEPGVEGLVHVSELSWTKKIRNPAQVLKKGDEIQVMVLGTDVENRRVSLSLRQTEDNPWDTLAERFPVGSRVVGKVRNVTEFGAFVEIEDGIDGLVHVSDFRWGERNADPNEMVKKGEEREVVVLAVDSENRKVSLGIKQLVSDPWLEYSNNHHEGQAVKAHVARITDNGVVVQLAEHVQGYIRHAALGIERGKKPSDAFEEGQEIMATIMRISHRDRRVDLSIKKYVEDQERESILNYTRSQDDGGATFGDVMKHLVK